MMKIKPFRLKAVLGLLVSISLWPNVGQAQFKDLLNKATKAVAPMVEGDVSMGLKQALEFGVNEAVDKLSSVNGYLESP